MRETKFRAWDSQKNILGMVVELSYSPIVHLGYVPSYVRLQNFEDLGEVIHYSDPDEIKKLLVIEQYTGINDIDDIEVFENDLITNNYKDVYEVEWFNTAFWVVPHIGYGSSKPLAQFKDFKVVGNIHYTDKLVGYNENGKH